MTESPAAEDGLANPAAADPLAAALSGREHPPAAVLAIDGGNSKTELALVAADGTLLAQVRGGRSNFQGIGMNEAFAVLDGLVRDAARAAGIPAGAGPVAGHASACLAGADLPDEEQQLTDLVQAQGWTQSSLVVNDTFAVLRAGLDDAGDPAHWGVGVTCGAGINCVGVAPDGRTTRFLSLGDISGDWGGGGTLASDTLWWAARAEDGRGPQTELMRAVPAHFGLASVRDVTIACYRREITRQKLHGLVPVLFEVASQGDRVAQDLVLRQADEIGVMAATAARRLDLTGTPVPVIVGGSVATARSPLLVGRLTERLAADLPRAWLRIVDVPPVAGAALLGLDRAGAGPEAAQRLRACFASLQPATAPTS
ncbi:MAG TPA: BadF/BadG/BcrA/BcrD ATPase family protein [Streptosporangiaceae bacterium]|nr:BadF/BadG/BcrA/BcrD ATPase family protein [Streptosporangiaceae bacterium]